VLKRWRRSLKTRLSFFRRRLRDPRCPVNPGGEVFLHIGCGKVNSPEFINVDALPYPHVHIVTDRITELAQFADGTVDLVYMCHILEHIRTPRVLEVLNEMRRMLKVGGVLRLSVPDFDRLIDVYREAGGDLDAIRMQLMGGQESDYNTHYGVFNHRSLSNLLHEAGFRTVQTWDPSDCRHHDFRDKACKVMKVGGREIAISLNLEAVK
jgi:predicted SAM-dependent methyltransferase